MSRLDMDKMMQYTRSLIGIPDDIKANAAKMYSDAVNKNEENIKNNIEAFKAFTDVNAVSVIRAILVGSKLMKNEYSDIHDIAEYIQKLGASSEDNTDVVACLSKYTQNTEKESDLWEGTEGSASEGESEEENEDIPNIEFHCDEKEWEGDGDEDGNWGDEDADGNWGDETEKQEEIEEKQQEDYKDSIEKGEFAGKAKKEQLETPDILPEELEGVIESITDNILSVYKVIYEPLYSAPPAGVLCTDKRTDRHTLINCGKANSKEGGLSLQGFPKLGIVAGRLYSIIKETCGKYLREAKIDDPDSDGMEVDINWMHPDGTLEYNYIPYVQVRNCNGIYKDSRDGLFKRAKNYSDFEAHYSKALKRTIKKFLERVDLSSDANLKRAEVSIQELYTNVICMNQFDPKKAISMTLHMESYTNAMMTFKNQGKGVGLSVIAEKAINEDICSKTAKSQYKLMRNETLEDGTQKVFIVTDIGKVRGEVNFAYKTIGNVLQTGGRISLSNVIVGVSAIDGSPISMNLMDNACANITILAETRSGKGVLTLALLSYMIATRCALIYIDYKPDMARGLWNLEKIVRKEYPNARTLAVDGAGGSPHSELIPGWGAPENVVEKLGAGAAQVYSRLVYAKTFELCYAIAKIRTEQKDKGGIQLPNKNKFFYILDEAEQAGKSINGECMKSVKEALKAFKPTKQNSYEEEIGYLTNLKAYFSNMETHIMDTSNTYNGKGLCTSVTLGQDTDAELWAGPFKHLVGKGPRFCGNGTQGRQTKLAPKEDNVRGYKFLGSTGYFAIMNAVGASGNPVNEVVKSSLVLNDVTQNDFNYEEYKRNPDGMEQDSLLKELLVKLSSLNRQRAVEDDVIVNENNTIALRESTGLHAGQVNELIGLPGLIKFIGREMGSDFNLGESLSLGYKAAYEVLSKTGVIGKGAPFDSIYGYLYSGAKESILDGNTLATAYLGGTNVYQTKISTKAVDPFANEDGEKDASVKVQSKVAIAYDEESEEQPKNSTNSQGMSEEELNAKAEAVLQDLIQNYNFKFGSNRGKALELVKDYIRKVEALKAL